MLLCAGAFSSSDSFSSLFTLMRIAPALAVCTALVVAQLGIAAKLPALSECEYSEKGNQAWCVLSLLFSAFGLHSFMIRRHTHSLSVISSPTGRKEVNAPSERWWDEAFVRRLATVSNYEQLAPLFAKAWDPSAASVNLRR